MRKQALAERKWLELIAECEVGLLLDHPFICRLLRVRSTEFESWKMDRISVFT